MAARDLGVKAGRRRVERIRRRHRRPGLVLDADRPQVNVVLARVIGSVVLAHKLRDPAVLPDDVVRRKGAPWGEEAPDRGLEHHDGPVVDDQCDRISITADRVIAVGDRAAPLDCHLSGETTWHPRT